jgi:hypothetical protein
MRHQSIRTETADLDWARRFILFHDKGHPADMRAPDAFRSSRSEIQEPSDCPCTRTRRDVALSRYGQQRNAIPVQGLEQFQT